MRSLAAVSRRRRRTTLKNLPPLAPSVPKFCEKKLLLLLFSLMFDIVGGGAVLGVLLVLSVAALVLSLLSVLWQDGKSDVTSVPATRVTQN